MKAGISSRLSRWGPGSVLLGFLVVYVAGRLLLGEALPDTGLTVAFAVVFVATLATSRSSRPLRLSRRPVDVDRDGPAAVAHGQAWAAAGFGFGGGGGGGDGC